MTPSYDEYRRLKSDVDELKRWKEQWVGASTIVKALYYFLAVGGGAFLVKVVEWLNGPMSRTQK